MITNEQRERRKSMIGSSDVPRIMAGDGVRVALEKLGELEPEDISQLPEVQLGNILEPQILSAFAASENVALECNIDTLRHADHNWLGAHLDAMAPGLVVEAKSVNRFQRSQFGEPGTDEVPDRVLWQVQEQLAVTRLPLAKVPVCFVTESALVALLTGKPLPIDIYVIPADRDLEAYIVERCGKVWQSVEARTLPEPEKPLDARLIYRKDSGAIVEATDAIADLHAELMCAKIEHAATQEREKRLAAQIQEFMKEASEIRYRGQTLATWKLTKPSAGYTVGPKPGYRKFLPKETNA